MKTLTLSCLLALPVAVQACPTAADLDRGIRFGLASGEWEIFQRVSDVAVEATFYYEPGEATRVQLARGIYLLSTIEIENGRLVKGSRQTFSYPVSQGQFPDPAEVGSWEAEVAILGRDGLTREFQTYAFGQPRRKSYGACTYQMIPITNTYRLDGEDRVDTDELHYLPELGISYLSASRGRDYADVYEYILIEAVE